MGDRSLRAYSGITELPTASEWKPQTRVRPVVESPQAIGGDRDVRRHPSDREMGGDREVRRHLSDRESSPLETGYTLGKLARKETQSSDRVRAAMEEDGGPVTSARTTLLDTPL